MTKKILILGANGFIGNRLSEVILQNKDWTIYAMDMATDKLENCLTHSRFHYTHGDITVEKQWIETHIQECDVVLPLVAIANPALYVKTPLKVFELDFEANLEIVRLCVKHKKRIVFPSTSEVYGMCADKEFDEQTSPLVVGPIHKQRWIYSCSKQMMDRVIYAYGEQEGLDYTLFRPFNWFGPKLDRLSKEKGSSSRAVTQFISNILYHGEIHLVDDGVQRRSFTYLDDGIEALIKIIENKEGRASQKIFNIGNPASDVSIKQLAEMLVSLMKEYPQSRAQAAATKLLSTPAKEYYGEGYQDLGHRVPAIKAIQEALQWSPKTDLETGLRQTLDYYLQSHIAHAC